MIERLRSGMRRILPATIGGRSIVVGIWLLAAILAWKGAEIDAEIRALDVGHASDVLTTEGQDSKQRYTNRYAAQVDLRSTLLAIASIDDGGRDAWSVSGRFGSGLVISNGSRSVPVRSLARTVGYDVQAGLPTISFLESEIPMVRILGRDEYYSHGPARGAIVVSVDIGDPGDCPGFLGVIQDSVPIVSSFEVADLRERAGDLGDVWLPLDPARSKAMERLCATQFDGDSFDREFRGKGQVLRFRLAPSETRRDVGAALDVLSRPKG